MAEKKSRQRRKVDFGEPPSIRFNILVVGESGSGKTTMLKTLFKEYCDDDIELITKPKSQKTVNTECIGTFTLCSDTGKCIVHLFDSPGYGDYINNQTAIDTVRSFLLNAHQKWLSIDGNKLSDQERNDSDERIHCIFYFIAPHRMKDIDKEFINQLYQLGPIIPVVGKADTMTIDERKEHLLNIRKRLHELVEETGNDVIFDFQEDNRVDLPEHYFLLEDTLVENTILEPAPEVPSIAIAAPTTVVDNNSNSDTVEQVTTMIDSEDAQSTPRYIRTHEVISLEEDGNLIWQSGSTHASEPIHVDMEELEYSHAYSDGVDNVISASLTADVIESSYPVSLPRVRNIFAIVCDTSSSGKRCYPWGEIYIHDENHSDFRRLQRLLLERSKILTLRSLTQDMSISLLETDTLFDSNSPDGSIISISSYWQQHADHSKESVWKLRWECFIEWLEMMFIIIGWTCLILVVAPWVFIYFILTMGLFLCALQKGFEKCMLTLILVSKYFFN